MPIPVLVVIVGLMLIAAIVWNSRVRRGTAANTDGGASWSGGGDSDFDAGSDGGCDGGGGDGGGGGD